MALKYAVFIGSGGVGSF